MDLPDQNKSSTENSKDIQQGGVIFGGEAGSENTQPQDNMTQSVPPASQQAEIFVVPPIGSAPPSYSQAGQVAPSVISSSDFQSHIPGSNPWPKRILILFITLLLLLGVGLGIKYALSIGGAPKEVTVVYWGLWESEAVMRPVIDAFQTQFPNIKIQYVNNAHRDYRQRLQTQLAAGTGPDVFRFHNTWVGMLQNDLTPVPQTIMNTSEFGTVFPSVMNTDLVVGQTIYGIPLMYDGLALFYNADLFSAAGVASPPQTWEQITAPDGLIKKLRVMDGERIVTAPVALGTTNNIENFSDIVGLMFMQNGANLIKPIGSEAEQTLLFYRKFASPGDELYSWNEAMDDSIYAFATGKVAMIFAPSWRAFTIKELNPALNFKIAPFPQLAGDPVHWATYWVEGVSSKSKNPTEAWEFVKFLTSKEGASLLYTSAQQSRGLFGEPYARIDLASLLAQDPYAGPIVSMANYARSFPLASRTSDGDTGLNTRMIKYLENAINAIAQGSSPSQELETMAQGFSQVLSSFGLINPSAQGQ